MSMQVKHVIFDLDGTLIDSSAGVLAAYQSAFESVGIKPRFPLTADCVGPPLRESLVRFAGLPDRDAIVDELQFAFKRYYDRRGYRQANVYPGIEKMLGALAKMSVLSYVATNKRRVATDLILEHFGLSQHFSGVYCLDSLGSPSASKSDLLKYIIAKHSLPKKSVLYVGDRVEDGDAAKEADIPFARAFWGYDQRSAAALGIACNELREVQDIFSALDIER